MHNRTTKINNNIEIAKRIMTAVKVRFPYGGINNLKNKSLYQSENDFYDAFIKIRKMIIDHTKGEVADYTINFLDIKAGYCDELANYAIQFAITNEKDSIVELAEFKYHVQPVIGRDLNSDPSKSETWGNDALFFDSWANELIISAASFKQDKRFIPNVDFFFDLDGTKLPLNTHYLDGNPCIDIYRTCCNYAVTGMPIPQRLLNAYIQDLQKLYKEKNDSSFPDINTCLQKAIAKNHLKNQLFLIKFAGAEIKNNPVAKKNTPTVTAIKKYSVGNFSLERFNALFFAFPNDKAISNFENVNQPPNKTVMPNQ